MAGKRANGEGTIYKYRDGFAGQITVGRNPATGKPKRKTIYGATQAEVRKQMTAAIHAVDKGTYFEPSKAKVGEWLDIWHSTYLGGVKPHTVSQYEAQIRCHLKPALGATKLSALTAPMIQSMYNDAAKKGAIPKSSKKKENPKRIPKGLSAKSIKNLHGVLHKALDKAVKLGYIPFNPADACELPRIEKKQVKPITETDLSRFLEAVAGHKYEALYVVTVFSGIRQGEALGLTWDCVDFAKGKITINKQLQKERIRGGGGKYRLVETKTSQARTVALAPFVMDVLRTTRKEQLECKLKLGRQWQNEMNLIFTHEDGKHLAADTVYGCYKRIVKKLGIDEKRFHDLRHTYATITLENTGNLKLVSEALGHSNIATTANIYAHITERMQEESARKMQEYIERIM